MDAGITGKAGALFSPSFLTDPVLFDSFFNVDPFFEIKCQFQTSPGVYTSTPLTLYRSEAVKQNLNPKWFDFEINMGIIGDLDNRTEESLLEPSLLVG